MNLVFARLFVFVIIFLCLQVGTVFLIMLNDDSDNKENLLDKDKWKFGFGVAVLFTIVTFPIWLP